MAFSSNQLRALRRDVDRRNLRSRKLQNGKALTYIEGWHAVSEANRIFGFGSWDRETVESRCILAREMKGQFTAIYVARVRITVRAGNEIVVREGHGTGEGKGPLPGEAHDMAIKTAETDATKRALATFGKPFGLSLYLAGRRKLQAEPSPDKPNETPSAALASAPRPIEPMHHHATGEPDLERRRTLQRMGPNGRFYVPSNTKPTSDSFHATLKAIAADPENKSADQSGVPEVVDASIVPSAPTPTAPPELNANSLPADDNAFLITHPRRIRSKDHLLYVSTQPCLLCARTPSDAHHLRYAQPRALSRKVSDEFTVPLCRTHHRQLHQSGDEAAWWNDLGVDPLPMAQELWQHSRGQ